ncbi:hypothetical protein [Marinifilum caeruleilacunae]|uniref:DUF304 domain-containing protein n=1 Tax=Marinifilum caeruleilacunae TaxID=2499076 RepID=A0ABX1WU75_9BACT|nr:hypothetical protein [Marinifilum caeruleilacunae]NOU59637.1 hypothetical protein [Marinifilum caeruleilacunae]
MKVKLSNSATDLQRIQVYAIYLFDIAIALVLVVSLIKGNSFIALLLLPFLILFSIITWIVRDYNSKLCDTYIDEEYLYIERAKLTDKVELSNIKSLKYHPFYIRFVTESIIIVRFRKETALGTKIYIYPTSLNQQIEYKSNRHILNLIAKKANNYIKARRTNDNQSF